MSANGNRPADRFRHLGTRSTDQYQVVCAQCQLGGHYTTGG